MKTLISILTFISIFGCTDISKIPPQCNTKHKKDNIEICLIYEKDVSINRLSNVTCYVTLKNPPFIGSNFKDKKPECHKRNRWLKKCVITTDVAKLSYLQETISDQKIIYWKFDVIYDTKESAEGVFEIAKDFDVIVPNEKVLSATAYSNNKQIWISFFYDGTDYCTKRISTEEKTVSIEFFYEFSPYWE